MRCKIDLAELYLELASAIFLISRVSNDPGATGFLNGLRKNKELEEMLYISLDQLDDQREIFRKAGKDEQYTSFVSSFFQIL